VRSRCAGHTHECDHTNENETLSALHGAFLLPGLSPDLWV
jgi:hypothetical protein